MTRRICEYDGCTKLSRNKGKYKNQTRYGRFCERHHRLRCDGGVTPQIVDNSKCSHCGWDKSYCDRHRIDPKKGYTRSNVRVLCPNCHRLVTNGLLIVN